jgi:hypothetical protein
VANLRMESPASNGAGQIQDTNPRGWTDDDPTVQAFLSHMPQPRDSDDVKSYTDRALPYSERLFKCQVAAVIAYMTLQVERDEP